MGHGVLETASVVVVVDACVLGMFHFPIHKSIHEFSTFASSGLSTKQNNRDSVVFCIAVEIPLLMWVQALIARVNFFL